MTAKEIVEAALVALDIFIGWPVAILIVVLLFRKQIEQLFGILGGRLRRISVGGATAEFDDPEIRELIRSKASSIRLNEPEYVQQNEESVLTSEDGEDGVGEADRTEPLEQELERLRGK